MSSSACSQAVLAGDITRRSTRRAADSGKHSLTIDSGWADITHTVLAFIKRFAWIVIGFAASLDDALVTWGIFHRPVVCG